MLLFRTPCEALLIADRVLTIPRLEEPTCQALRSLRDGCEVQVLYDIAGREQSDALLAALREKDLIVPDYDNPFVGTAYEKQIHYFAEFVGDPAAVQRRLSAARVMVVGLGGVGTIALQHLLAAGIRRFVLIDSDRVEASNFNRQFGYVHADIGRPKVEAMAASLHAVNPGVETVTYEMRIDGPEKLRQCAVEKGSTADRIDFVLGCADEPIYAIHRYIAMFCREHGTSCSFAAIGCHSGSFGPLLADRDAMIVYEEQLRREEELTGHLEIRPMSLSIGFTNTLISAMFVRDIIHHLAGLPDGPSLEHRCVFDFRDLALRGRTPVFGANPRAGKLQQ